MMNAFFDRGGRKMGLAKGSFMSLGALALTLFLMPAEGSGLQLNQGPASKAFAPGDSTLLAQGPGKANKWQGQGGAGSKAVRTKAASFSDFDQNGDGKILKDEFEKVRGERMSERAKEGYHMRNVQNAPPFEDMDANGDGEITAAEFQEFQSLRSTPGRPRAR
jgi:hypothetical protein